MSLAVVKSRQVPWHRSIVAGAEKITAGVPYGATLFEYVAGSSPPIGSWWVFTEAGWVPESVPGLATVYVHTITPTIVNAAAAQTDVVTIDGVACSFTSDATPTAAEIVTGLKAAIAASTAVGKFVVSGTTTLILTPATSYSPVVSVSANLTDVLTIGAPVMGTFSGTITAALPAGTNNIGDVDVASIAAGETHIGEVGGNTFNIVVTPAVGAAAFSANDIVGAKLTLANAARVAAGSGIWHTLVITDAAKQAAAIEIFLCNADITVANDNAAEATSVADMLKCVGHVVVAASDWKTLANASVASLKAGFPYDLPAGTTMYAFIRCTGTPTFTANCLQLTFGMLRD